jgi:hypothetical protein
VTAHPGLFVAALVIGVMFGWAAAWTVLRQRLVHHRELVDYYKDRVAFGPPAPAAANTVKWRIASPLFGVGAAFMLLGILLAYFAPSVDRAGYGMILSLFGLLLLILAIGLITNPELKPIAKGTKGSVLHAVQGDVLQPDSDRHGQEERSGERPAS